MSKIWEIDFMSFSGSSSVLYDKVGTQHVTASTGTILKTDLPGFTTRSGVSFIANSTSSRFDMSTIANAQFRPVLGGNYIYRSFSVWIYIEDPFDASKWDSPDSNGCSYYSDIAGGGGGYNYNGLGFYFNKSTYALYLTLRLAGSSYSKYVRITEAGWYHVVVTVDRINIETRYYIDGILIEKTSYLPDDQGILTVGKYDSTVEGTYRLGRITTYDHILTESEINGLWQDFLPDNALDVYENYAISGVVYSGEGIVSTGTAVCLLSDTMQVKDTDTTDANGNYDLTVPVGGNYLIVVDSPASATSLSMQLVAISGNIYLR